MKRGFILDVATELDVRDICMFYGVVYSIVSYLCIEILVFGMPLLGGFLRESKHRRYPNRRRRHNRH